MKGVIGFLAAGAVCLCAGVTLGGAHRVVDGDTVAFGAERVRIAGIDTAEKGQTCVDADGAAWDCAQAATDRVHGLIDQNGPLSCYGDERDYYGRLLATCFAGKVNIGAALVAEGLAWPYRNRGPYLGEAATAEARGVGIWQADNQTPWNWRKSR